jgi:glycosyltransferase involved in cell wall biosynthesis
LKKRRILLINNYIPPHYLGGAEVVVYNSCRGLGDLGYDASLLMINARMRTSTDEHRQHDGIRVHEVTFQPYGLPKSVFEAFDPRVYRATVAEIDRLKPDLVHVHNLSGASLAPLIACRRMRVPVVLTLHDLWLLCPNNMLYREDGTLCDPARDNGHCHRCFRRYDFWAALPRRRALFAWLARDVNLFIAPSRKLIDLHVSAGYDAARFRHVPNGIRPAGQPVSDSRVLAVMHDCGRFRTLLYAGAISEIKGVPTLIAALPQLTRYVRHLRLIVAGVGDGKLLAQLRRYGLAVQLMGQVPFQQMRGLYAAADLLVVPSVWYENGPMTIAESLMAGTPVVGSAIGGIPEFIDDGQTGYLFPPGDATALTASVIGHMSRSSGERRAMRRRCAESARTALSLELYLDRLEQVYDEVLAG